MKEYPILFNTEMVRAILNDTKTQTRRVVKPKPDYQACTGDLFKDGEYIKCPYGKAGDRLWVRETFGFINETCGIVYKANGCNSIVPKWKPSIFMPRKLSRITLEITDIRVERVQEITEADAKAEGVIPKIPYESKFTYYYRFPFVILWDSINEKRGFGWGENPWVWVVEFKRL